MAWPLAGTEHLARPVPGQSLTLVRAAGGPGRFGPAGYVSAWPITSQCRPERAVRTDGPTYRLRPASPAPDRPRLAASDSYRRLRLVRAEPPPEPELRDTPHRERHRRFGHHRPLWQRR